MIQALKKTWLLLTPQERRRSLLMLILIFLMATAETAGVVSIMPFLSVLGRPEIVHEQRWISALYNLSGASNSREFMLLLGVLSMIAVIASSTFKAITLHLVNHFVYMRRHSISIRLLACYLSQPYEFFITRNPSELSKNVLAEADQLTFGLLLPVSMLIAHGIVALSILVLIVLYDPWMAAAVAISVSILYCAIYLLVRQRLRHVGHERNHADVGRYQTCNEALAGIKDMKVMHTSNAWLDAYSAHSRNYSRHMATAETLSTSPLYAVEAAGYSGLILIALFLLLKSNDVAHVLPALGLYGFAAYRLLPAAQIMYRGVARLQYSAASLETLHRDLHLTREKSSVPSTGIGLKHEIKLTNISYAYPSNPAKPVLENMSIAIPANASIGIVGQSGSGKSTLMDILLGLLEPQQGTMEVDGVRITHDNASEWQRSIGYVPQHAYLTDSSVASNIALGIPENEIDMRAVEKSARAAQIHDFVIGELPQGYETRIGERGIRLSGGQRQRLCIARALYRDPPVLFMDEATSALDEETEAAITAAINHLSGEKTVIIISHRAQTLSNCDDIIELLPG